MFEPFSNAAELSSGQFQGKSFVLGTVQEAGELQSRAVSVQHFLNKNSQGNGGPAGVQGPGDGSIQEWKADSDL